MWIIRACIHQHISNYTVKQMNIPSFIVRFAKTYKEARSIAMKILNPLNSKNIVVVMSAIKYNDDGFEYENGDLSHDLS